MTHKALSAAQELFDDGISCEIVDLRTLLPWDKETVIDSIKKTGNLVIVHEACKVGGVGAEIGATIAEEAFDYLDGPIMRVGYGFAPVPFSPPLEDFLMPNQADIVEAVRKVSART